MTNAEKLLNTLVSASDDAARLPTDAPLRAFAWARVSTGMQAERGLSIPEQLREIRSYAGAKNIEILAEFQEAASGYRYQARRHEFHRMIARARAEPAVTLIIVHDYSRFGRSDTVKSEIADLRRVGIEVLSVTEPKVDEDTAAGVYMQAITFAKNEAFSKDVAFHTRKGCRANVQTRDVETGWCFKNGGQPLFWLPRRTAPARRGETRAPSSKEHLGAGRIYRRWTPGSRMGPTLSSGTCRQWRVA